LTYKTNRSNRTNKLMKIKKGDTIKVIKGKERGKTGKVLRIDLKKQAVIVEGLNLYKKHARPKRQGEKGEVVRIAKPLRIGNVALFCSNCKRAVRVGARVENGKKVRYCKKCKVVI